MTDIHLFVQEGHSKIAVIKPNKSAAVPDQNSLFSHIFLQRGALGGMALAMSGVALAVRSR